jgi:hypothetical protein
MTDRLAQLEAQAATLNAEIAKLRAERPAPPPPVKDVREVSVTAVLDERSDLPDLKQMQKLFAIVKPLSPWPSALHDRFDEHRPFRAFSSTLRWMMNVPRADRPNGKVALSYWLDVARGWLRARNSVASDLDANALILAVLASGDVAYCPANHQLGAVWELGLVEFGGRPASPDGWKRILREGASAVLPPSSPARRLPMAAPVRIYGG